MKPSTPALPDLSDLRARLTEVACRRDAELAPMVAGVECVLVGARPFEADAGPRQGLTITLRFPPRDLGRVLASPALQDRLTALLAEAIAATEIAVLVDLEFAVRDHAAPSQHPYRGASAPGAGAPAEGRSSVVPSSLEEVSHELLAGYFEGRANAVSFETSVARDELVVTVFASSAVYGAVVSDLRNVLRRIATKILLERQSPR